MPSLCHARLGPPPPPPPPRDPRGRLPYAHAHSHSHRRSLQTVPPMRMTMMAPSHHPHFHYSPYHHHGGPPVVSSASATMYWPPTRPSADAESRHAAAVHRWHHERAAGTGTGRSGLADKKKEEEQDVPSAHDGDGDDDDQQDKEDSKQRVQEHESGCKSSPSQDDMYENALLLASLAKSPGKDNSNPRRDRRSLDQNDDFSQSQPRHPQPRADRPQDQVDAAIPKPNIVTPVSSERQFVEELHHHHRVELSPPDQSFYHYQRQERGGEKSGASQPSIFRTPQKKREHAGSPKSEQDQSASKAKKKMRSVYHQHPSYPAPNGYFISPGPPLAFPKEGTGPEYPPPPYPHPYPHNLPPRFDSGRSHRQDEEVDPSPSQPSSPAFPFPPPRFASSRHAPDAPAPAVDSGKFHKMVDPMRSSQFSPRPSHPLSPQFIYRPNDHYLAAGTVGQRYNHNDVQTLTSHHDIGFRRSTKQKEYPAIASVDPKEAYVAGKTVITRSKWAWRDFPELEAFLVENRETYLQHSAMNYTSEQKEYNNKLTERLLQVADENGYVFYANDFDFVSIRDRIRCYYKSYVQANKKKGKIVSYPKVKRTLKADREGIEDE